MEILIGRLHPLFVHFPIALLMLLFLIEVLGLNAKFKSYLAIRPFLIGILVLSVWVTIVAGFQLFNNESYAGEIALAHKNGGIGLGIGITVLAIIYVVMIRFRIPNIRYAYLGVLGLSTAGMIYTSHMGGSLTHGEDFLQVPLSTSSEFVTASLGSGNSLGEVNVYEELIRPVLKSRCMSCHNDNKTKGNFKMNTWEALMAGGDSHKPILVSGKPDSSELYHRMILPLDDDSHMPPSGKPQMDSSAIMLIEWWIKQGADPTLSYVDSLFPKEILGAVQELMPEALNLRRAEKEAKEKRIAMQKKLDRLAQKLHVDIKPDPLTDSTHFALSLRFPPAYFGDNQLAELLPYAEAFSKISLPGAEITDDGLYYIGQLTHLRELYLPKTCLKGSGLSYLQALDSLEVLNISETEVDEKSLFYLLELPSLKKVYLYQTPIGLNMIHSMNEYLEEADITPEQGPYF